MPYDFMAARNERRTGDAAQERAEGDKTFFKNFTEKKSFNDAAGGQQFDPMKDVRPFFVSFHLPLMISAGL
jgi:hypothetical protein